MPLSWNEIRDRAHRFARDWAEASSEDADAKTFWDEFFTVFGLTRRRVASFETRVKKIDGKDGYIDLLWKGILMVEHKSRGKDLDAAHRQALDYFHGIKERDLPHWVLVSDFDRFRLYDLDAGTQHDFKLKDLPQNIKLFGFIAGYQTTKFTEQDPVNVQAAEKMGRLHDALKDSGYTGHALELLLVRLLFCLFAEDAGAFDRRQFQDYIEQRTADDGSDLGSKLAELYDVLNTADKQRQKALDEQLAAFKYVNGELFAERLPVASFDKSMREALLECCALDWSKISPAIFGAMFQSIMDEKLRRSLGAHYTSEKNIMKVIGPLFLDGLKEEFEGVKNNAKKLEEFHKKLASLKFLDPACGCGNFLIIAYREIRELELQCLRILLKKKTDTLLLDVSPHILCNVDQFYGIEVEEFPAQIASTAMWLMDHQMNMKVGAEFGQYVSRLPLTKKATIVHHDALTLDWKSVVKPAALSFIYGNPPFVGSKLLDDEQRKNVANVFHDVEGAGVLDFVAAWYKKAADYMAENPAIRAAFVSTNSIAQGEQVGILWGDLIKHGIKINFAHRTFQWSNEARGVAAVHCVIIGFAMQDAQNKKIFEYESSKSDAHEIQANNINPYLVDAANVLILSRGKPLCAVPEMGIGNKPIDDSNYLFTDEEKRDFLVKEPNAKKYFSRWLGSDEFINGWQRWCLWLGDCPPEELKKMPEVIKRVEAVRKFRLASKSAPTRALAAKPTRFHVENMPSTTYLLVPEVSSERRPYIPIGFMAPETLCSNLVKLVPAATKYHFGIMSSAIHMAWVRNVCGRLKSDYRYSKDIVYNNFPWPEPSAEQKKAIEKAAQGVLDVRGNHKGASLADLYDPNTMPPDLVKAHRALDAAVDAAYSKKKFAGDSDRVAHLFALYQKLAAPLDVAQAKPAKKKKVKKTGSA